MKRHIPWIALGESPTRVERLEGLLPPSAELWIKREDQYGARYGGNKVRKLEFLFANARAEGKRRLVTFGGYASHHVAATAIYGPREGFSVEALLFPQRVDDHARELLLAYQAAGATLIPVRSMVSVIPARWTTRLRSDATWLVGGGSCRVGTLGYVSAGFELLEQIRQGIIPHPDRVYVALGSGGTVAGLLVSLWAERPIEIVAVSIVDPWAQTGLRARGLARQVERWLGPWMTTTRRGVPPKLRVERRFAGRFGVPTAQSEAATAAAAAHGLKLDPIYTGKVMAALLHDARTGVLDGKHALMLHTFSSADLTPLLAAGPGPDALPPTLRAVFTQ